MRNLLIGLVVLCSTFTCASAAFQSYTVTNLTRIHKQAGIRKIVVTVEIRDDTLSTPAAPAVLDGSGNVITPAVPAGPTKVVTFEITAPANITAVMGATPGSARLAAIDAVINSRVKVAYNHWVGTELDVDAVETPVVTADLGPTPVVTVLN